MRYYQIVEAFAPAVKWQWTERKDFEFVAVFKIGKVSYTVSCFRYDSSVDAWELAFEAATKKEEFGHRVSKTGNAWKVFGTVIAIARQFIVLKQPKILKIESDVTERSRLAVNRRIAAAIVDGQAYTVSETDKHEIIMQAGRDDTATKETSYVHND